MRRDRSFCCKCVRVPRAGFRFPAQTRPPTRFKRGRWARSRQELLVGYVLQHHSIEPDTVCRLLLWCCVTCHTNKLTLRKCAGLLVLTSYLQQQCSSIMMHPSGHPSARRRWCTHSPIPSRQPRSVCTSTWSTPCVVTYRQPPCVLRSSSHPACSVPACTGCLLMNHTRYRKPLFIG